MGEIADDHAERFDLQCPYCNEFWVNCLCCWEPFDSGPDHDSNEVAAEAESEVE